MTDVCLIGYGKMGRIIEELCPQKDCRVVSIIDPAHSQANPEISRESLNGAEVAIDFSHPSVVAQNVDKLIELSMTCVIGTTGWNDARPALLQKAATKDMGLVYGANFSLGLNLFSRIMTSAVQIMDTFEEYDLLAWEKHHNRKADSPSGTAIELARLILANSTRKSEVVWDKLDRRPQPQELHFASMRGGHIPGTHALCFDSEADSIELIHTVRSRSTFAFGAIAAAKWISGKKGIFSFDEVIGDLLC
ncbi:MAG: 4-hydroxy-tetrahydrodipicolinate reductase [Candidatus Cloacimonetes bacterium]|jgi:4-hydroxy-tetrahydrodipicolinate reductase|nr:4-hydroxy-tetrahydrodipicolinate reductase [Candidatus Cloacimonadota bacterium]MDD4806582.1 4-hydroxy-tetrahydrodipicolinate reductase [Candidatus Cloacimonadota bacterium]